MASASAQDEEITMDKLFEMWAEGERRAALRDGVEATIPSSETREEKMARFVEWLRSAGFGSPKPVALDIILPPRIEDDDSEIHRLQYEKLETPTSIRILQIHPLDKAESDEDLRKPIHCSMVTVDLDNNPDYDALSYTWGDPLSIYSSSDALRPADAWAKQPFDIICDGNPVSVGTNLYTSLLAFRWQATKRASAEAEEWSKFMEEQKFTKTPYLWVDALCINQKDMVERNAQVGLMSRLYSQASSTYIWLGGEDECFKNSFLGLQSLCNLSMSLADQVIGADICDKTTYQKLEIAPITVSMWMDMYGLLSRSWLKRAWIVQEAALAKKVFVLIGLKMMPLLMLQKALIFLRRSRWIEQMRHLVEPAIEGHRSKYLFKIRSHYDDGSKKLYSARVTPLLDHNVLAKIANTRAGFGIVDPGLSLKEGASPLPLAEQLNQQRFTEATNPRDKIYAFMGISKEMEQNHTTESGVQLVVDYRKSVREVYTDAAYFIMASTNSLKIVSLVQDACETKITELPSWVPDFSVGGWPYSMDDGRPTPWQASQGLGEFKLPKPINYRLPVQGIKVGVVGGTLQMDLNEPFFSMFTFVQSLPSTSQINDPQMNPKLEQYLREADVEDWLPARTTLPTTGSHQGAGTLQSRFEVLWRTMLLDCFHGLHPAPPKCGVGFDFFAQKALMQMQLISFQRFLEGDLAKWNKEKMRVRLAYATWQALKKPESGPVRPLWPPDYHRNVKALEASLPDVDYDLVISIFQPLLDELKQPLEGEDLANTEEVLMKMKHVNTTRKIFKTVGGELGMGTDSIENGDEIWLLVGADVPFTLRKAGEGDYKLLGEAYVHGIMHGEAVGRYPTALNPVSIFLV